MTSSSVLAGWPTPPSPAPPSSCWPAPPGPWGGGCGCSRRGGAFSPCWRPPASSARSASSCSASRRSPARRGSWSGSWPRAACCG